MAFGGGALLSAVALVLVPEGIAHLELLSASVFFIAGGLFFMFLDIFLNKIDTPASQLAAMLADFHPLQYYRLLLEKIYQQYFSQPLALLLTKLTIPLINAHLQIAKRLFQLLLFFVPWFAL